MHWCTDKENKEHAVQNNLHQKGSRNGKSKLTEDQVSAIKDLLRANIFTQKTIAERFNIHPSVVSDINNQRIWKHVD